MLPYIVVMCSVLCAGNLDAYWNLFETHMRCAGGFIWDWADQCLVRRISTTQELQVVA
jgi:beta-galactosidase/beta-glucuronidase